MLSIFASLLYEILKTGALLPSRSPGGIDHVHSMFITFYGLECVLKMIGLGPVDYATSGWNAFDFIVAIISAAGQVMIWRQER